MRKHYIIEIIVCDRCGKECRIAVKLGEHDLCHDCAIRKIESDVHGDEK